MQSSRYGAHTSTHNTHTHMYSHKNTSVQNLAKPVLVPRTGRLLLPLHSWDNRTGPKMPRKELSSLKPE